MKVFVSFDGDHIGRMVGRASLSDKPEEVSRIAQAIERGNRIWQSWVESHGGKVINIGGDEGRLEVEADHLMELPKIRDQYQQAVGSTVSVGVGTKLSEADKSLMAAKLQGGDRIQLFTEAVNELLEEMQEKPEGEKIYEEYFEDPNALQKAQPGMNQGTNAGFSGASRAAAPARPVEGSEHSETEVARSTLGIPEPQPGQPVDYEQMFHQVAASAPEEQSQSPSGLQDGVRAKVIQILQDVRSKAPMLEEMRAKNPDLYESVKGLVEAMIAMAQSQDGGGQPEPVQKAEGDPVPDLHSGPIAVDCHTCHRKPGQPCRWERGGEEHHVMRVKHWEAQKKKLTCPTCIAHHGTPTQKAEGKVGQCKWRLGERRCQRIVTGDYCHSHKDHWANKIRQKQTELEKALPPSPESQVSSDALQERGFKPDFVHGDDQNTVVMSPPQRRGTVSLGGVPVEVTTPNHEPRQTWTVSLHGPEGRSYGYVVDAHGFDQAWEAAHAWHTQNLIHSPVGDERTGFSGLQHGIRPHKSREGILVSPGGWEYRDLREPDTGDLPINKALPPATPEDNRRAADAHQVANDQLMEGFSSVQHQGPGYIPRTPNSGFIHNENAARIAAAQSGVASKRFGPQATNTTYTRDLLAANPQTDVQIDENDGRRFVATENNYRQNTDQGRLYTTEDLSERFAEEVQNQPGLEIPDLATPAANASFRWTRPSSNNWIGLDDPNHSGWILAEYGGPRVRHWHVMKDGSVNLTAFDAQSLTVPGRDNVVRTHLENHLRSNPNTWKSELSKALPPIGQDANQRAVNEQLVDQDALREQFATEERLREAPRSIPHTEAPASKVAAGGGRFGPQAANQTYTRDLLTANPQGDKDRNANRPRSHAAAQSNHAMNTAIGRELDHSGDRNQLDQHAFAEEIQNSPQFQVPNFSDISFQWRLPPRYGPAQWDGLQHPNHTGWVLTENAGLDDSYRQPRYWHVMKDGTVSPSTPPTNRDVAVKAHLESYLASNPNVYKTELEKAALEAGKTGRHQTILPVGAQIDSGPSADHEAGKIKVRNPEDGKTKWRSVRAGVVMAPDGTPTSSRNPGG